MRKKQRWIAVLLALVLLMTTGCEKSTNSTKDQIVVTTAPSTEPAEPISAEDSLNSLRQALVGTPQIGRAHV